MRSSFCAWYTGFAETSTQFIYVLHTGYYTVRRYIQNILTYDDIQAYLFTNDQYPHSFIFD
jgi:hypothetical protein